MSTSFLPEPPTPVVPEPVVKAKRKSWTQPEIVALVTAFHTQTGASDFSERDTAKLIELGLVAKPEKAGLTASMQSQVESVLQGFGLLPEPDRTLMTRYAIKQLQALLPKRPAK